MAIPIEQLREMTAGLAREKYAAEDRCLEFNLPDEERFYELHWVFRCPLCQASAQLLRTRAGPKLRYRVICSNHKCAAPYNTAQLGSSDDAIRCWVLASRMVQ